MEGDVGHVSDVLLVLGNGLGPGDHGVGDVAVAAAADEGQPVRVHAASVHLAAELGALIQDHGSKVSKTDAPIVELQNLESPGSSRLVNNLVLKC